MSSRSARTSRPALIALIIALVALAATAGVTTFLLRDRSSERVWADPAGSDSTPAPTATSVATPSAPASPTPTAKPSPSAPRTYPATGPNTYVFAAGTSAVFGEAGTLRRYRVAIETGTPVPIEEFAGVVDATLSDPRSWIAGKNVRLQRVPGNATSYQFTVYLVTPGTAQRLCLAGGFDIFWRGEPYTSCRVGGRVLINISRYLKGVPNYGAPLADYQRYAINHEVGHALGHGHELCPGKGKPAPVMQQQTFGLQGCVAYFWPYLDGKRYAGPPGRVVPSG